MFKKPKLSKGKLTKQQLKRFAKLLADPLHHSLDYKAIFRRDDMVYNENIYKRKKR